MENNPARWFVDIKRAKFMAELQQLKIFDEFTIQSIFNGWSDWSGILHSFNQRYFGCDYKKTNQRTRSLLEFLWKRSHQIGFDFISHMIICNIGSVRLVLIKPISRHSYIRDNSVLIHIVIILFSILSFKYLTILLSSLYIYFIPNQI